MQIYITNFRISKVVSRVVLTEDPIAYFSEENIRDTSFLSLIGQDPLKEQIEAALLIVQ